MKKYIALFAMGFAAPFLSGAFEEMDVFRDGGDVVFSEEDVFRGNPSETVLASPYSFDEDLAGDVFSENETKILQFPSTTPLPHKIAYETENWMEANREIFNKKPFYKIILPGAHDAGAFGLNRKSKVIDLPKWLATLRKAISSFLWPSKKEGWFNTQNLAIKEQLNAGIRFFDLRVCRDEGIYYLYHGLRGPGLEPVFQTFRDFLRENKGEIIVLSLSHFIGVSHEELTSLIKKYLGEFCATKRENNATVTYETLIDQNKRCFIYYSDKKISEQYPFLLTQCDSYWANQMEIDPLCSDLKAYHSQHQHSSPWVLQYVLTPNKKYISKYPLGSVETLAKITHAKMEETLKDFKQCFPLNIVMFDFVDEQLCRKIIDLNF